MNLAGGTFAFSPTDLSGNGHTITLNGVLSGGGALLLLTPIVPELSFEAGGAARTKADGGNPPMVAASPAFIA